MTSQQILAATALIFGIATACQILAPRLRMPALILLLPAGFIAGQLFPIMDVERILGAAFIPVVNLVVAVILFHGGLQLSQLPLARPEARVVRRLVWYGSAFTWLCVSLGAYYIIDLPLNISVLLGAILIVSGPTVVNPLLDFVKPTARVRNILSWEGTLIDPLGALTAVVVFQAVKASDSSNIADAVANFFGSLLVGLIAGVLGVALIYFGLRVSGRHIVPGTQVLIGSVIVAAGFADYFADDSGLVAAVTMGMVVPFIVKSDSDLQAVMPFFETIVSISIGLLFVSVSALVTPASLRGLILPTVIVVLVLVLVVRPLVAWVMTIGSPLNRNERLFIGWMAPRGIVAAASAASFAAALVSLRVPGAGAVLPVTFMVIAGTVAIYGLTAVPVAKWLGVRQE